MISKILEEKVSDLLEQPLSPRKTHQDDADTAMQEEQISDESQDEDGISSTQTPLNPQVLKGKRKEKSAKTAANHVPEDVERGEPAVIESIEGMESNEDEGAAEEVDDAAEADIAHRNEDLRE